MVPGNGKVSSLQSRLNEGYLEFSGTKRCHPWMDTNYGVTPFPLIRPTCDPCNTTRVLNSIQHFRLLRHHLDGAFGAEVGAEAAGFAVFVVDDGFVGLGVLGDGLIRADELADFTAVAGGKRQTAGGFLAGFFQSHRCRRAVFACRLRAFNFCRWRQGAVGAFAHCFYIPFRIARAQAIPPAMASTTVAGPLIRSPIP